MLFLGDGTLVLWGQGRIQLMSPDGKWSETPPLGLRDIAQVVPDGAGFLVNGSWESSVGMPKGTLAIFHSAVLSLDRSGAILERWEPCQVISSVASVGGKRWATGSGPRPPEVAWKQFSPERESGPLVDEIFEIPSRGGLVSHGGVEMNATIASFLGGADQKDRVDCVRSDRAKATYRPAYCVANGARGWRKQGLWDRLPLPCGPYLVEVLDSAGSDLPLRNEVAQILVRRLDNGEVAGRRPFAPDQAVACGGPGELLVGRTEVQSLSLPDLATVWRRPAKPGRVVALSRAGDRIMAATTTGAVVNVSPASR